MLVSVTGGMSRELGGLYPEVVTALWGTSPVRTIGGWRSVEIAIVGQHQQRIASYKKECVPFCPDSAIDP